LEARVSNFFVLCYTVRRQMQNRQHKRQTPLSAKTAGFCCDWRERRSGYGVGGTSVGVSVGSALIGFGIVPCESRAKIVMNTPRAVTTNVANAIFWSRVQLVIFGVSVGAGDGVVGVWFTIGLSALSKRAKYSAACRAGLANWDGVSVKANSRISSMCVIETLRSALVLGTPAL